MSGTLLKLMRDPIGLMRRALHKTLVAPFRYGTGQGYDAGRYWRDRFVKHGMSLKGVGDEGLSEDANEVMYRQAADTFLALCERQNINFAKVRVLEIGCGNGFYTHLLRERGVKQYVGVDITDVLFPELAKQCPDFTFIRRDVTTDAIDGQFDLILMIDVIEHIVGEQALAFAMNNIRSCLTDNGTFIVAPIADKGKRSLFYVRFWTAADITQKLAGFQFSALIPFRYSHLLIARKPGNAITPAGISATSGQTV